MAVFWLVLDCVKAKAEWAQSLLLLRASGGQFNVYACRYRAAKVVLCALKELCQTGALTNDCRSSPQTNKEASHTSLRSPRHVVDEKPEDLQTQPSAAAAAPLCA